MKDEFGQHFEALTGNPPFPWQRRLYERMVGGSDSIPSRCDIPTGLGKTSVIAVWLLARQANPSLPRRLAYVVNRRTVVDQTTDEVERIRKNLHKIGKPENFLAISTLRGQFADNREWSADPSKQAVICGTVDMIGSRLLFSGYGLGFKSKPMHAGFLGQDVLLVHDEAHLEPAFQTLVENIEAEQKLFSHESGRFRVMELSATRRSNDSTGNSDCFALNDEDRNHTVVRQRIHATKKLLLHKEGQGKLGDQLATLALERFKDSGRPILIFVRLVEDLKLAVDRLRKAKFEPAQLTGTMRGQEREDLIHSATFARFLPESNRPDGVIPAKGTVFLVCTSAGEVGVNISADHLVCDLSTFESMTQRFGRLNRFGHHADSEIHVIHPENFEEKPPDAQRKNTLELLRQLTGDANPHVLSQLDTAKRAAAFAPPPQLLPTTDILFDAWSLTSIPGELPGRPPVEPYLHGISEWEPPVTQVAWREEVATINTDILVDEYPPAELLELFPLKPHEMLRDRTERVWKELTKLAAHYPGAAIWIVDDAGKVDRRLLNELTTFDKKRADAELGGKIVLLPHDIGGLTKEGLLDGNSPADAKLSAEYDIADKWVTEDARGNFLPMRERRWELERPAGMKLVRTISIYPPDADEDGEPEKQWYWYARPAAVAPSFNSRQEYDLQPHLDDAKEIATTIVGSLDLPIDVKEAVVVASKYHDLGKHRARWQSSIGNDNYDRIVWAKSGKRAGKRERLEYRHEAGSLADIRTKPEFKALSQELQELVLHLVAAHHGWARPHFTEAQTIDGEANDGNRPPLVSEVPRRFARLQRKYGRWGLAYLESLVRAADYLASQKAEGSEK